MSLANWLGTIGVSLLLLAYLLDINDWTPDDSPLYLGLNAVGAGLACASAVLIPFIPFVVLEGIWCLVSVWALLRKKPSAS
jgi:hypothetical protein